MHITRKYAVLKGLLVVLLLSFSAVMGHAQDSLPNAPAFNEDVHGIVLLNGWNGAHADQNAVISDALQDATIGDVLILNADIDRPEDTSVIEQQYNASVIMWWSQDADKATLNFAVSMPTDEAKIDKFNRFAIPTSFDISTTDTKAASGVLRALWFYTWENYAVATGAFTLALNDMPAASKDALYLYRGMSFAHNYDYESAGQDFDRVPETSALAAWAHYNSGILASADYDNDTALDEYAQAITLATDRHLRASIFASQGYLYYSQNDMPSALEAFTQSINIDNTNADVYQMRGLIYYNQADYELAAADYGRMLAIHPNDTNAWQFRAYAYIGLKDYKHAAEDYSAAVKIANDNHTLCQCLLAHRGNVYYMAKEYELAIADFEQSLSFGDYLPARMGLAKVYVDLNQPDDAKEQLAAALNLATSGADYLSIGSLYEKLGDASDAGNAFWQWVTTTQYERVDRDAGRATMVTLEMTYGRVYYIPVTLKAGQMLTVSAIGTTDALVVLLDGNQTPVAGSDDVSETDNSAAINSFKATRAGQYTLVVTHAGGSSEGMITAKWSTK